MEALNAPPAGCAVVMAHPDDEVLWASSVLSAAGPVILCYGDFPGRPVFSAGRRQAVKDLPLSNVSSLDLTEATMFGHATWPIPEECAEGLLPRQLPFKLHAPVLKAYKANFLLLCKMLEDRLSGITDVVTHNPWGEYGHEDHVQVFRAVEYVAQKLGYKIWVTGYVSDKAVILMQRHLHRLGPPSPALQTEKPLGQALRKIYIETGSWTWPDDYIWPDTEWFFPLLPVSDIHREGQACRVRPVTINLIEFNWTDPGRVKQIFSSTLRHIRYIVVQYFPFVGRLHEKLRHNSSAS